MRRAPALLSALAVAAVVVTSLVGCSSSSSDGATGCRPVFSSGDVSSTVDVSGSSKVAATASFPTPLVAKSSQVSVTQAGSGSPIQPGDQVDFEYTVFSGSSGAVLGSSGYGASGSTIPRAAAVTMKAGAPATSVFRSLICARDGERYTLTTTAAAGFGAGTLSSSNIANSDTLVIVVDIRDHFIGKADGVNVLPKDGLPSVITAVDGQPGIVLQELIKPTSLQVETVKAGSGATVKKGATVRVKYTGWTWPGAAEKPVTWDQQSWDNDQAVDLKVASSADGGSLPTGLESALVGAKVGSQVLAVIPPKDGFPASSEPTGVTTSSTLIMVIDVLGIK